MGMGREIGRAWNARVHDIGNFQSRVLLTVFYFTIFVPFAMLTRLFSDPLRLRRRGSTTAWSSWSDHGADLDAARRQF